MSPEKKIRDIFRKKENVGINSTKSQHTSGSHTHVQVKGQYRVKIGCLNCGNSCDCCITVSACQGPVTHPWSSLLWACERVYLLFIYLFLQQPLTDRYSPY